MERKCPGRANGQGSGVPLKRERLELSPRQSPRDANRPKRCAQCDRELRDKLPHAKFCSDRCRQRKNMPRKRIAVSRWKVAHPLQVWSHRALDSAIRMGLVERQPCEVCGSLAVDGHHEDHSVPLAVRWLCRRHHKAAHRADPAD